VRAKRVVYFAGYGPDAQRLDVKLRRLRGRIAVRSTHSTLLSTRRQD
jgi:hypothetical protein